MYVIARPHTPPCPRAVRRAQCPVLDLPPSIVVRQPFDFPLSFVCVRVRQCQTRIRACTCVHASVGRGSERRPNSASLSALSRPPGRRYPPQIPGNVRAPLLHVRPLVNQKGRIFSGTRAPQIARYNGNLVPPIKIPNTYGREPVDNAPRLRPSLVGL